MALMKFGQPARKSGLVTRRQEKKRTTDRNQDKRTKATWTHSPTLFRSGDTATSRNPREEEFYVRTA